MRIYIIVQARMSSTRLPGKVLMHVLDKPLLEYQLERLKRTNRPIVVATTTNAIDDRVVTCCEQMDISTYRGDELDVLDRYYEAANSVHADTIVRITADCPLIDPDVVESVIRYYLDHDVAYVSNCEIRSYPKGMDTEVFSMDLLKQAHKYAKDPVEREHVTPYMRTHFPTKNVLYHSNFGDLRLTVDYPEDFEVIKGVIEELYPQNPNFTLEDILNADRIKSLVNQPALHP